MAMRLIFSEGIVYTVQNQIIENVLQTGHCHKLISQGRLDVTWSGLNFCKWPSSEGAQSDVCIKERKTRISNETLLEKSMN